MPPIAKGFGQFVDHHAELFERVVEAEMAEDAHDPYDSHPPLKQRIDAISGIPEGEAEEAPAITLLADVHASEKQLLLDMLVDPSLAMNAEPIGWDAVGEQVYLPMWRESRNENGAALEGMTLEDLPEGEAGWAELGARIAGPRGQGADQEQLIGFGTVIVGQAICAALGDRGFGIETPPGDVVICRKGDAALEPFKMVVDLKEGDLTRADLVAAFAAAGVEELPL